jgi:hypothetical protein
VLTLNRSAIVVTPKKPFLDWVRGVDPSNRGLRMADLENDPSVYLFPAFSFDQEIVDHLKKSCTEIFEQELESWDRVRQSWPPDRSFAAFQQWFDYTIHSMIFDLADDRLELEEM